MNTAIVIPQNNQMAEWESKIDLIRRTVAKDATNDELAMFFHQAHRTGLDPLARQIYFVKRQGKGTIQTGIDGYRLVADRTGKYAGNDDYEFDDPENVPKWAKATVYKMVDGVRCPFTATARWSQYCPVGGGMLWNKMPHLMLGKCAEALALRKAFPADLSGVYTTDEMHQAEAHDIPTIEVEDAPPPPKRVVTGTITDIQANDKGTFYKLQDGDDERIATTINKDFVKKLAGAHGLYVELACHSQPLSKVELIVDVLHIKFPEDSLVPALEASIKQVHPTYDDERGLAMGVVKSQVVPAGKQPMKITVQCGGEAIDFHTFSKTSQKRLSDCTGKRVELTYKLGEAFRGKAQREITEVVKVDSHNFRAQENEAMSIPGDDEIPF